MTAPTTRETADHIGEVNEKVADHIGDATTMIDHAELKRLAEAATPAFNQETFDAYRATASTPTTPPDGEGRHD